MKIDKQIYLILIFIFFISNSWGQHLPKVKMETQLGDIVVELDTISAPVSANNFLEYVRKGSYNDAVFYRVVRMDNQPNNEVKIEVIQGGVFADIQIEKIKPIRHESTKETGLKHLNGTFSMARSEPGSASSEFFICVGNQPELDFGGTRNPDGQGFAAFGQVIEGMDVVRKIQNMKDEEQALVEKIKIDNINIMK